MKKYGLILFGISLAIIAIFSGIAFFSTTLMGVVEKDLILLVLFVVSELILVSAIYAIWKIYNKIK